jgi:hypothetical protein
MIFKNNERVKVSELPEYKQMLAALPEIAKGEPVIMKVVDRAKREIVAQTEGEDSHKFYTFPTRSVLLLFETVENGVDRVVYRYQEGVPKKDKEGNYNFRKVNRTYTSDGKDTYVFNTDPNSPSNRLEELFLLWAFSPLIENGKVGNKQKAFWRFTDFVRDTKEELDNENKLAELIIAINKSNIEQLSGLYFHVFGRELGNTVNLLDVRKQFVAKVKSDENIMIKAYFHLLGEDNGGEVSEQDIELAKAAIQGGFIIQGVDGVSVVLKTAQKEEVLYEGDASDVDTLSKFIASDSRTKATIKRVTK